MWALGCLLFAWWHCFSPFECIFTESGAVKVVECSHSRVLNRIPVFPSAKAGAESKNNNVIHSLCSYVLEVDFTERPHCVDVILKIEDAISAYDHRGPLIA